LHPLTIPTISLLLSPTEKIKKINSTYPLCELLCELLFKYAPLSCAPTPPTPALSHSNSPLFSHTTRFSASNSTLSPSLTIATQFSRTSFKLILLVFSSFSLAGSFKPNSYSTPLQLPSQGHFRLHTLARLCHVKRAPHLSVFKKTKKRTPKTKHNLNTTPISKFPMTKILRTCIPCQQSQHFSFLPSILFHRLTWCKMVFTPLDEIGQHVPYDFQNS